MKETYLSLAEELIALEYKIYLQNYYKQINKDIADKVIRNSTRLVDFDTYRNTQLQNYEFKFYKLSSGVI